MSKFTHRDSQVAGALDRTKAGNVETRWVNLDRVEQDPGYSISKYGREFLRLRKLTVTAPVFVEIATPQPDYY